MDASKSTDPTSQREKGAPEEQLGTAFLEIHGRKLYINLGLGFDALLDLDMMGDLIHMDPREDPPHPHPLPQNSWGSTSNPTGRRNFLKYPTVAMTD